MLLTTDLINELTPLILIILIILIGMNGLLNRIRSNDPNLTNGGKKKLDTLSPHSMDSGDETAPSAEASFDYDDGYDEMCRDSVYSSNSQSSPRHFHLKEVPKDKRRGITGLKDIHSSSEEFPEEETTPDDIDLEKFKMTYLSDKMITEETEEEIKAAEDAPAVVNRKKNRRARIQNPEVSSTSESAKSDVTLVAAPEKRPIFGIFHKKPQLFNQKNDRKHLSTESSTELDSTSVDMPTITITEDALHDSTDATLRASSLEDIADIPEDDSGGNTMSKKADAIKHKVIELSGKVKDLFHHHQPEEDPEVTAVREAEEAEKRMKKEEDLKRKREDELHKKEIEMKKREDEKRAKEEEKRLKDEDKQRKLQVSCLPEILQD